MIALESRELVLHFDTFGWEALEYLRSPPATTVELACTVLEGDLTNGRDVPRVPRFKPLSATGHDVHVELPKTVWTALEREALAQDCAIERLVEHAVMILLARGQPGRFRLAQPEGEDLTSAT